MQPVITYRVPSSPSMSVEEPKIQLKLYGESHALNRIFLTGFEDYFESDPCLGTRILPYFIALGEILAPEWDQKFDRLAWFRGEQRAVDQGDVRAYYTKSGDELPADQIYDYQDIQVFVFYGEPCNPLGDPNYVVCPARHLYPN